MNRKQFSLSAIAALGVLTLAPSRSKADPVPKLERFFEEKVRKLETSMAAAETQPSDGKQKPIVIENINIDLIPTVSIGVSEVLNLQISPEVDFVLQPDPPESGD